VSTIFLAIFLVGENNANFTLSMAILIVCDVNRYNRYRPFEYCADISLGARQIYRRFFGWMIFLAYGKYLKAIRMSPMPHKFFL
jgi:hypothetical protein